MKLTSMNHELNKPLFTGLCHFPYLDNRLPVFFFRQAQQKKTSLARAVQIKREPKGNTDYQLRP